MFTNRFISVLIAISLLAVVVLVAREANASTSLVSNIDSTTRSYAAQSKAVEEEASTVDSATRSYTAQAKAIACAVYPTSDLDLDSATRSYIAWAKSLECQ